MGYTYDPSLVVAAILAAWISSYTALELARLLREFSGLMLHRWRLGAAVTMGGGIFMLHLIAMLALRLPVSKTFSIPLLWVSLLIAVVGAGATYWAMQQNRPRRHWAGGLLMGLAMGGSHLVSLEAERFSSGVSYDPWLAALALLIAVAAAGLSLRAASLRHRPQTLRGKVAAATWMTLAAAGLHFTLMAGTTLDAGGQSGGDLSRWLLVTVAVFPMLGILMLAQTATAMARRSRMRADDILESMSDGFLALDTRFRITYVNREAERILGDSRRRLLAAGIWDLYPLEGTTPFRCKLERVMQERVTEEFEEPFGPAERWYAGRIYPAPTGGIAISFRDVTDEKRTQAAVQRILERSQDIIATIDFQLTVRSVNQAVQTLLQYEPHEVTGRSVAPLIHPDDLLDLCDRLVRLQEGATPGRHTMRGRRKDGSTAWFEAIATPVPAEGLFHLIARDVTEQRLAAQRLEESEQQHRSLFEHHPDAVFQADLLGRFTRLSQSCVALSGYTPEELIGRSFVPLLPEDQVPMVWQRFADVITGQGQHFDTALVHKDGHRVEVRLTSIPVVVAGQIVGLYGIARDITETRQAEAVLRWLAYCDPLTGLPNRVQFMDRLKELGEQPCVVCFLDLDRFKLINDSLGHRAGDDLLKEVARRLEAAMAPKGLVARYGGDEFAILMPGSAEIAEPTCQQILESLLAPITVGGKSVVVTPSIGVVSSPGDLLPEDMIRYSDMAMYEAKRKGKARFEVFTPQLSAEFQRRLLVEEHLRKAIGGDQFRLHYQPIVQLETGQIDLVEALIRWEHPELGTVKPDELIAVAEETGLIVPLGRWVLRQACWQQRAWREEGYDLRVSINISVRELLEPDFAAGVKAVLAQHGVLPTALQVEVTESVILPHEKGVLNVLHELRRMGMQVAVDDFGTGYSSLHYLKRMPVDVLKIDRSFVSGMGTHRADMAIIRTIIAFASALDLNVAGEGVETAEQLAVLKELGCHRGQGYYWSPAVSAESVLELIRQRNQIVGMDSLVPSR